MSTINPYIGFNGKCREAMTFYKACFGGELELLEVGGSPMEAHSTGPKDEIYHAHLISGQITLMGTDFTGPAGYHPGNNISIAIACSSEADIRHYFTKLSEGGTIIMPLEKTFWAELFGGVKDKYGIDWMMNYDKEHK
jgi:PhnB protein